MGYHLTGNLKKWFDAISEEEINNFREQSRGDGGTLEGGLYLEKIVQLIHFEFLE